MTVVAAVVAAMGGVARDANDKEGRRVTPVLKPVSITPEEDLDASVRLVRPKEAACDAEDGPWISGVEREGCGGKEGRCIGSGDGACPMEWAATAGDLAAFESHTTDDAGGPAPAATGAALAAMAEEEEEEEVEDKAPV